MQGRGRRSRARPRRVPFPRATRGLGPTGAPGRGRPAAPRSSLSPRAAKGEQRAVVDPPVKPCMRFSRTRLADVQACSVTCVVIPSCAKGDVAGLSGCTSLRAGAAERPTHRRIQPASVARLVVRARKYSSKAWLHRHAGERFSRRVLMASSADLPASIRVGQLPGSSDSALPGSGRAQAPSLGTRSPSGRSPQLVQVPGPRCRTSGPPVRCRARAAP